MKQRYSTYSVYAFLLMMAVLAYACSGSEVTESGPTAPGAGNAPEAIVFDSYLQRTANGTRTTYPVGTPVGAVDNAALQAASFAVFAQYTENTPWASADKDVPFNFMWHQKVDYDTDHWTYSPVKYWPNDNQPADNQDAQGSVAHSYLTFFAYAPYQQVDTPTTGFDVKDYDGPDDGNAPDHDGIVAVSRNGANMADSYVYYRTSLEKPFGVDESVDLLWATAKDRYKYDSDDANDDGRVADNVQLVFKHALTKLAINAKTMIDRTADHTSPAYSTAVDGNSRIFIESVDVTSPEYYTEGKLMLAPNADVPTWNYADVADLYKKSHFMFGDNIAVGHAAINSSNDMDDINYSMRYAAPNIPAVASITDTDSDGQDDDTGLTLVETARAAFDAMEQGVTDSERQLSAGYPLILFLPSTDTGAFSVHVVYHVVTFDPNLTLNAVPYFSDVTNNITATLGDASFRFDPNKQYKLVLNLGLTSAKFEISVLNDAGEYILLSSVVKEWDVNTKEVNVE